MAFLKRRGKSKRWYLVRYQDGRKIWQSLATSDKRVAEYLAGDILKKLHSNGLPPAMRNIPVGAACLAYLRDCRARLRKNHFLKHRARLIFILRAIDAKTLRDINTDLASRTLMRVSNTRKWQPKTYNHHRCDLATFCQWCYQRSWIPENPISKIPIRKLPKKSIDYLKQQELDSLFDALKALARPEGKRIYGAVATAALAGLRASELLALEWQDVDFKNRVIHVRHKMDHITKTGKERSIPLSQQLESILLPLRNGSRPCFRHSDKTNLCNTWNKQRRRMKLPTRFNWLVLRHTFATRCAQAGIPMVKVRDWMGHGTLATTNRYYLGVSQEKYDADIERISQPV